MASSPNNPPPFLQPPPNINFDDLFEDFPTMFGPSGSSSPSLEASAGPSESPAGHGYPNTAAVPVSTIISSIGHHHLYQQQQQEHLQPAPASSCSYRQCQSVVLPMAPPAIPTTIPGGIEVVWREISEACKAGFRMTDIPDTARMRGYFTVCELISLKRKLLRRYTNGGIDIDFEDEDDLHDLEQQQHGQGERLASSSECAVQHENHQNQRTCKVEILDQQQQIRKHVNYSGGAGRPLIEDQCNGQRESIIVIRHIPDERHQQQQHVQQQQQQCSQQPVVQVKYPSAPPPPLPPPYRSINLVLKLLQIGTYIFRSFSEINPNRCRVLFNSRRILYECNLPVVQPIHDSFQPLRKLLTIDVNFDQISAMQFDSDKLFIHVEGPPSLTVTYNPVEPEDANVVPNVSELDRILLEQIENGHLRLSPLHHLYFLNERLVQTLKNHFRELPQFRRILMPDYSTGYRYTRWNYCQSQPVVPAIIAEQQQHQHDQIPLDQLVQLPQYHSYTL